MGLTRRDLERVALAGIHAAAEFSLFSSDVVAQTKANHSLINGVQFGLQRFCYHDLAMNTNNRPVLIHCLVENGMGMVELHATWCEPRFYGPGVSPIRRAKSCGAGGWPRLPTDTDAESMPPMRPPGFWERRAVLAHTGAR
jgi:hypothetical protein